MLALIGGGRVEHGETLAVDQSIMRRMANGARPRVVALPPATLDQASYALRLEDQWQRLGADVTTFCLDSDANADSQVIRAVDAADIVYLGGGSLAWYRAMRRSPVAAALVRCARDDARMLAGISAGALIANDGYFEGGWGLLPSTWGVEVHAHLTSRMDRLKQWTAEASSRTGFGLPDGSGLIISRGAIEICIAPVLVVRRGEILEHA